MAEHGTNNTFTGPTTPEALLADRQKMWNGFTNATVATVVTCVLILVGMGVFLL